MLSRHRFSVQPCFILRQQNRAHTGPPLQTNALDSFDLLLRQSSTVHQSKQLHAQIIIAGLHHWSFLSARLISIYSSFNLLSDARLIFSASVLTDRNPNLLLWNSILRANLSQGHSSEAFNLYLQMRELRVSPDGFSFPLIIRACASIRNPKLCRAVHHHVILMGFQFHLHVGNELIGMYGKIGQKGCALQVFDRMPHRSVVSWNTLISCYAMNYDCDGAFGMFERMALERVEPNPVTWTSVLSAHARCGRWEEVVGLYGEMRTRGNGATAKAVAVVLSVCADLDALEKGKEIHGYVIRIGFEDYVFVKNSLICMYGKHGQGEDARVLFSEMKMKSLVSWNALISSYAAGGLCDEAFEVFSQLEKTGEDSNVRPNVVSWSAVIGGFAWRGRVDESLELFCQMQCVGIEPNSVTIAGVLSVCAELAALGLGQEIHCHVIRGQMDANILVENGLLHMYAKCGSLRDGKLLFERMEERDLISWNSMITGYGMHGFGKDALRAFDEMVEAGIKPDGITFVALLSACSHAGLVAEGRWLFDQMTNELMLVPQMEHYACMVDLLGRAGLLQEASEFVKTMPMKPNACVWGALLNSCRIYKNTTVAEEAALRIHGIESETAGSYMLLSNIYAACGRWEDSARVRVLTKTRGLKKNPGQSWIEVKKKVFMFSAGNASQPGLEGVHGILEDLGLRMEAEGYIPDNSFVLQNVGEEEKKQILYGHSEKLAIAFGHANVPPNMPIRVMKNLRVCGDCHNWTKFFSKMTGRNVIVRDGHRFHHFMDGSCSCKDYW
ncbi:putative pentatricopeptide repeat-containing protein At1g17630 [Magnolia sinica]|uniref:putative pentatricopeptide repeat-containing protein At1g17630 n=1 Tax=Magnolia sinica TaxID=86752 RepID=UPI0026597EA6|nr:putative pentatricopeptide repeat-containing protein At1g17630 [Magnolia sinica]XP_058073887.1 putative pentatricopeptide repeat-containing protein At1g17630 [Magnolia sinica]XP_058073888.1 putative pentatricopeptide repeat-containing protein At1g17630 [Magnolia sinica]XP_058073889.1 putative pentatricopeptide repeat-containing protein At1g17630 [Magnolia sinica]XP_058073890.1 putative pentatricopeptide repeat-containing protein At1g17630 [Magnolia sinica]XP_058073891.1 putative pentatricop